MKNLILIFTLIFSISHIFTIQNMGLLQSGPIRLDFFSIDKADYIATPNIARQTNFKIDKATGFAVEVDYNMYVNNYISPYGVFLFKEYNKGYGSFEIFNIQNCKKINIIEQQEFSPRITTKLWAISNEFKIYEKECNCRKFELNIEIGYNSLKSHFEAIWENERSISDVTWKGFLAGLNLYCQINEKITLGFCEYIYPEKLHDTSTRDSFLGEAGTSEFLLFGNEIINSLTYKINEYFFFEGSFEWFFARKLGNAKITLTKAEAAIFKNPRILFLEENIYSFLFSFGFYF